MPPSHIRTDSATASADHIDRMLSDLGANLRRLAQQPPGTPDFARMEAAVHQCFAAAERDMLTHELRRLDVDRPAVRIAGRSAHRRAA